MHRHRALLADAIGAIRGLILHGGIPPAVEVEDVVGRREIEARAARLEGENEERRPAIRLETLHHAIPPLDGRAAVEIEHLHAEERLQILVQHLPHLGELGEDQGAILHAQHLLQHLRQALQLAGAPRQRGAIAQKLRRMIANLLQAQKRAQHRPLPRELRFARLLGIRHALQRFRHHRLIERRLLLRQRAGHLHLQLLRQILDDGRVALEAAQDKGIDQIAQPPRRIGVLIALDGQSEGLPEPFLRSQETWIEELHNRPQFGEPIFNRRPGERHAIRRLQPAGRLRLLGAGILDILRLI